MSTCQLVIMLTSQLFITSSQLSKCQLVNLLTCQHVILSLSMKSLWDMILNSRMVIAGGRAVGKSALAVRFLTRRWLDILFMFNSPLGDSSISGTLSELINWPGSSANTSTAPSWFIPRGSNWKRGKLWPLRSMTPTARCKESTIPLFSSSFTNLERAILESLPLPSSLAFGRLLYNRYFCSQ